MTLWIKAGFTGWYTPGKRCVLDRGGFECRDLYLCEKSPDTRYMAATRGGTWPAILVVASL